MHKAPRRIRKPMPALRRFTSERPRVRLPMRKARVRSLAQTPTCVCVTKIEVSAMERFAAGSKLRAAALGIAVASILGLAGCQPVQTRDDFKGTVMNKSPAEVEDHMGKPHAVDESDPTKIVWIYNEVTFDVENKNKRDPETRVIFTRQEAASKPNVIEVDFGS
jgi:hypothetical protein